MEISYDPNFPRLPSTIGKSPVSYRSIFKNQNAQDMQTAGIETAELDEFNFCSDLMFGNPHYFGAFFTEVIYQTIPDRQNEKPVNPHSFIAESAGKRMGIPIDIN